MKNTFTKLISLMAGFLTFALSSGNAQVVYQNLYLVGDATPASWDIDNPTPMTLTDTNEYVFIWDGELTEGDFKIPTATGDWGCDFFMPTEAGESEFSPASCQLVTGGTLDNKWHITDAGAYSIVIDIEDLEAPSIEIVRTGELRRVYGLGEAMGWDSNEPLELARLSSDLYSWTGFLERSTANKLFKFTLDKGSWDQVHYINPVGVAEGASVMEFVEGKNEAMVTSELTGDLADHFWGMPEGGDGIYSLTVDMSDTSVYVEPVHVYGLGADFGWDSRDPFPLLQMPGNKNQYIIIRKLENSAENKLFKFTLDKGDWNRVHYLNPTSVDYNDYSLIVTPGNYKMQVTSELDGNLLDHFWGIPEGADSLYILRVDLADTTLQIDAAHVYGLGTALGWDSNNPLGLTQDLDNPDLYTWKGQLVHSDENKIFKFTLNKGNWDQVFYINPVGADETTQVKEFEIGVNDAQVTSEMGGDLLDHFWGVPEGEDGNYKITVNLADTTVTVEKTVSLEEMQSSSQLRIYPNPASEKVYVELFSRGSGSGTISFYNLVGKKVHELVIDMSLPRQSIDLSSLSHQGLYIYRITGKDIQATGKLLIK
jgi:Outer membrane protein SusF_SusE/Secretion system C-terminal sorting domain